MCPWMKCYCEDLDPLFYWRDLGQSAAFERQARFMSLPSQG
jgi:hypothetical protein